MSFEFQSGLPGLGGAHLALATHMKASWASGPDDSETHFKFVQAATLHKSGVKSSPSFRGANRLMFNFIYYSQIVVRVPRVECEGIQKYFQKLNTS